MVDMTPVVTDSVRRLIGMECEMITAEDIAPVVHMSPGVIIRYAKTDRWDQEKLGRYIVSGNRVKFFRLDFLRKGGWIPPEPEEKDTMGRILEELTEIRKTLAELAGKEDAE